MAAGDYGYTGMIEKVTVGSPGKLQAGHYDIVANGGGGATGIDSGGGKGATYAGYFTLTQGEKLEIIVGGAGTHGTEGGGGGGFSEVLANVNGSYVPLLVAGGGGGGGFLYAGGNATIGAPGTGSGGAGGGGDGGAGGAGSTGNGGNVGNDGANGGMSVANGAGGGSGFAGATGGFGGGGGGGDGGGGGGGYTGGNGGAEADDGFYGGAGGTSFLNKTYGVADIAHDTAGANAGKGSILFTLCFAAGTLIRTARGEVAVEALQIGDLAVTASGAQRPIKWLGHRTLDCRRHPSPREAMPVRVAAHAFGENRPARDLVLSPGHSVCVDVVGGVLIPIGRLVNGATIRQLDVDTVTYWHVELDSHDILLAENLACESYIDCGTRAFFAESGVVALGASPDAPVLTTDDYCRSFKPEGALVDMVRDRLCLRASDLGWRLAVDDALAGLWLEVDGARIEPTRHGLLARATLPADAREVRLRSASAVPADLFGGRDERRLGLRLASVVIDDGLGCRREIACTDARLADGFHPHEGTHRWTDGAARLPAELWEGCRGDFRLRLAFAGPALPRWVAPAGTEEASETTAAKVA